MLYLLLTLGTFLSVATAQNERPAPRHSLVGPYRPGSVHPFWEVGGHAQYRQTDILLTPDTQSKTGYLWSASKSVMTDWIFELVFYFW